MAPSLSFGTEGTFSGGLGVELGHGFAVRTGADYTRSDGAKRIFYGAGLRYRFGR